MLNIKDAGTRGWKVIRRRMRYHWLTEYGQYLVRRDSVLDIHSIDLRIAIDPTEIIIDCGANVGDVTSVFARSGATVYAFEPNPYVFKVLSRRFRAMRSVHCLNYGAMNRRCTLKLRARDPHAGKDVIDVSLASSFIPESLNSDSFSVTETEVECIDLSEFIEKLGRRVRLLKLDIEGSEIPVLNHLIDMKMMDRIDLIAVETHEKQMPQLLGDTNSLRERIEREGLGTKCRLDWP
jgi:FkbM family methyltransferase